MTLRPSSDKDKSALWGYDVILQKVLASLYVSKTSHSIVAHMSGGFSIVQPEQKSYCEQLC